MSTGFYFMKSDGTHQALPVKGSYLCERTREPANLLAASDYPVTAECQWCHGRIRLSWVRQMEWVHDATALLSPAGGAA